MYILFMHLFYSINVYKHCINLFFYSSSLTSRLRRNQSQYLALRPPLPSMPPPLMRTTTSLPTPTPRRRSTLRSSPTCTPSPGTSQTQGEPSTTTSRKGKKRQRPKSVNQLIEDYMECITSHDPPAPHVEPTDERTLHYITAQLQKMTEEQFYHFHQQTSQMLG